MKALTAVMALTIALGYGYTNAQSAQRQIGEAAPEESRSVHPTPRGVPITIEKGTPPTAEKGTAPTIRKRAKLWTLQRIHLAQWRCIDTIIYRESRWIPSLFNTQSNTNEHSTEQQQHETAYGLGQVKGSYKYTKNKPMKQYKRAVKYMIARYDTFCRAKAHHDKWGWY